ncbi:polyketide cyclase/dehydrase/lipid transport protein [Paucimonas lemoignei]|uniref:Polyketide cyclase/dehydrase/lipid transport protein n=1 Tax=Paucimonas lemoignei TaxID=29443 RepID=A0A4R3HYK2_PAULE|nr:SRPBCC family protein [Paucimonas lemoignei]TCS38416.1 polyketide cyclase/dehydrase/lipid transport protein [Paucimonas lemoignei]
MLPSRLNKYHLTTLWKFDAPLELVWKTILDSESWPQWWQGVERVVTLDRGDASGIGARQRYIWKSALPYRLKFVSRVTRVEPMRILEGRVEGDVEGIGCWHFGQDKGLTIVRYEWHVQTTRSWMNVLSLFAKPFFRRSHDALMRAGGQGLAHHLQTCLVAYQTLRT